MQESREQSPDVGCGLCVKENMKMSNFSEIGSYNIRK